MSKRTVRKVQRIFRVVALLGFMFTVGTVGALDNDAISLGQGIAQAAAGVGALGLGCLFGGLLA